MSQRDATPAGQTRPLILLVEDEASLATMLRYNLEKEGFRVCEAGDGEEALTLVAERRPDLVLLDWMLPSLSGIEVCRQLRRKPATRDLPIIMLTARGEESDKIRGLNTGADDYLTKPFSLPELMARARALLRRAQPVPQKGQLSWGDISMDLAAHRVTRAASPIKLGPTEFRLLSTLMEKPGRVWTRDQLLDRVWGRDIYVDTRTIDVHVGRLRKALMVNGGADPVRTVRGTGYSLG